ncbi:MAG: germination protein YpeB, partial [Clostridia bacterium]
MKSNGFKIWLILATCVAIIAVTSVSVMAVTHNSEKMKNNNKIFVYKTALENKYQDSFYELMDSMKNMEINLSKLAVSQSAVTQESMLIKLALQAENAETNAAELPIYTDNIAPTIKFINQVSDFCQTLIKKVNIATGLSTEDKKTLSEMHKVIITLKDNISKIYEGLKDISIADIVNKSDGYNNNDRYVGNGFSSNKEETFDYPKLIYDGPFSDSIEETQESNLTGKTYTVAQLKTKV